ncbi:hypothetical protein B484DRAFT_439373 [Ochromonadaceae sp. CCMP2298]|nr:hypothetical protein B484DRAFT_439373 [Ochromonadaceae sp. CCMP2298]
MWNYLYFIFMLWEQDKDDDDGLEQYVRRAIDANEIVWFPMNKAIRLDQAASSDERLLQELKKVISKSEGGIAEQLEKFQTNINVVLEQLNQTLKLDHVLDRTETTKQTVAPPLRKPRRPSLSSITEHKGRRRSSLPTSASLPRPLVIELTEVSGLHLPGQYDRIVCNVTVGAADPRQVFCSPIWEGTMNFTLGNKFELLPDAVCPDDRILHIALMKETTRHNMIEEIYTVHVNIGELMLADGLLYEATFCLPGNPLPCTLSIFPTAGH